jgi:hypothetical protein
LYRPSVLTADTFEYEAVAQENGNATIIKFPIDEKLYSPGDVVVVVSGEDINFPRPSSARSKRVLPSLPIERLALPAGVAIADSPIEKIEAVRKDGARLVCIQFISAQAVRFPSATLTIYGG